MYLVLVLGQAAADAAINNNNYHYLHYIILWLLITIIRFILTMIILARACVDLNVHCVDNNSVVIHNVLYVQYI